MPVARIKIARLCRHSIGGALLLLLLLFVYTKLVSLRRVFIVFWLRDAMRLRAEYGHQPGINEIYTVAMMIVRALALIEQYILP